MKALGDVALSLSCALLARRSRTVLEEGCIDFGIRQMSNPDLLCEVSVTIRSRARITCKSGLRKVRAASLRRALMRGQRHLGRSSRRLLQRLLQSPSVKQSKPRFTANLRSK